MNLSFDGKVALVSGSTGGIGLAIAKQLASLGAKVIITGRNKDRVDAAVHLVREAAAGSNGAAIGVTCDLSTADGVNHLTSEVADVDVLVNNMGIFVPKRFLEIPEEDWFKLFEANVMSGIRLSKAYLPKMLDKNWGRIVFISSDAGRMGFSEAPHYGMTKAAQISISRSLADETKGTNVTVNTVCPGPTKTAGVDVYFEKLAKETGQSVEELMPNFFKTHRPTSLVQRLLTEEEVANAISYICSPASSGTNGSVMHVEGGIVNTF